jgi:hypothetical protein
MNGNQARFIVAPFRLPRMTLFALSSGEVSKSAQYALGSRRIAIGHRYALRLDENVGDKNFKQSRQESNFAPKIAFL